MPVLPSAAAHVKQFYLPSTATDANGNAVPQDQQAWVKMDVSPLNTGDLLMFNQTDAEQGLSVKLFAEFLVNRIKEWNYTEADGSPVPITFETVCRLDQKDFAYLSQQQFDTSGEPLSAAQKKS